MATPSYSYLGPSRQLSDNKSVAFLFQQGDQYYEFIPKSVFDRGVVDGKTQYYFPNALKPDFFDQLSANATFHNVSQLTEAAGKKIAEDLKKQGFDDSQGWLLPLSQSNGSLVSWADSNLGNVNTYSIGRPVEGYGGVEMKRGPIQGIFEKNGQRVFSTPIQDSPVPNAQGYIQYDPETGEGQAFTSWYEPPPKWTKAANAIGLTLIGLGTAGAAGFGPLAAPSATAGTAAGGAAGTGAGIVGTPGVSTIYPVAAPVAPTVGSIAPIATATAVPASQLAFPALEVGPTFTPAPGSLQAALPGLGVETAASAAPYTAAPGSFQAALPAFGVVTSPGLANTVSNVMSTSLSPSITGALLMANALTGQPQQVPQQRPMGGQAGRAGGVDYSELLGLLQTRAATANVAPLTRPATLLPQYNPLSLLG